jgi:tetratricopeptide (TPR) repeat protein
MWGGDGRHAGLAAELGEWWEDLWQRRTGSRVVLVAVPSGWGRTTVLDRFEEGIDARDDAPVTLTLRIEGQAMRALETAGLRAQALARALEVQVLRADLSEATEQRRLVKLLGLDEPVGREQLGLGVANLFFSGLTAGISFLLAGLAAAAAGKAWDDSPAGQDGALARAARAVAAVSVEAPVTVVIDDADCLDEDLAVTLVENLTARQGSQVFIIAVVDPSSALSHAFRSRVRQGLTSGLVYNAEADPDMGYESRLELARQLRSNLPDAGPRRIAQRTATFGEVFTVAAAPRLAEIEPDEDEDAVRAVVDAATSGRLNRPAPSLEATMIAWAGGLVHVRQAARALGILGAARDEDDPDVRRWESLERLADPAAPRLADQVATGLSGAQRRDMAAAFLDEALTLTQDPGASLVGKVAALQAAHRIRTQLTAPGQLPRAQRELAAALEALGDSAVALQVASEALAEWPAGGECRAERDELSAAVIRLSRAAPQASVNPLAEQLIAEAQAGGAATGLEARIWAAVVLLDTPGQREGALALAGQVAADLDAAGSLGPAGDQWRLLLAYHVGRAGLPDLTARLLTPLTISADPARQDAAAVVRHAVGGPGADTRLQNILLEANFAALPPGAEDDRLRLHHALAVNHATLGEYRSALDHGQQELDLRTRIQGPCHPGTLDTRQTIATWTGLSGNPAEALDQCQELLKYEEQVLGPGAPPTLTARYGIARWTGECGDAAEALRLYRGLLPDMERVLGPRHIDTLSARGGIASWTGECGNVAGALRLFQDLLYDEEQLLGLRHSSTMTTRQNIAGLIGKCGDAAGALRLFQELLRDQEQVLGPRHPDTLNTRGNLASWTGKCGDVAAALRLFQELRADEEQVLGADHRVTLTTRHEIARLTGEHGGAAEALRLFQELLPDQQQALGSYHPDTLTTRVNIGTWTNKCGDISAALRFYQELLPDLEQFLGAEHLFTLSTRHCIAGWTGQCGDAARALRLYQELLPDLERALGPDDPSTLTACFNTASLTSECGDGAGALRLYQELLPDLEQGLGHDHPVTLSARFNTASLTSECGDGAGALRLYQELLPDLEQALGHDHPATLSARANVVRLAGQGNATGP